MTNYLKQREKESNTSDDVESSTEDSEAQNRFGLKVLARTMAITALIFIVLGLLAEKGMWITVAIGVIVGIAALMIFKSLVQKKLKRYGAFQKR